MQALDVLLWCLQSFIMCCIYELCMWHAITAFACTRLYLGNFHMLAFLPLAYAGAITQLLVHFFDKLAVMGSFKYARLVWCSQVETTRMQQVLAHPDFQANPLAAIRNHLAATLPEPAPVKPQSKHKQQPRRPKQETPKSEAAMMQS